MEQWYIAIDGKQYGPVDWATLLEWHKQGRVTPEHLVWKDGMIEWVSLSSIDAFRVYLAASATATPEAPGQASSSYQAPSEPDAFTAVDQPPSLPYQSAAPGAESYSPPAPAHDYSSLEAHRGGMILTFGILSIFCCIIFGILAWVFADEDLKKMDAGLMDPTGRGTTQAGKICGIIGTCLQGLIWFFQILALAASA